MIIVAVIAIRILRTLRSKTAKLMAMAKRGEHDDADVVDEPNEPDVAPSPPVWTGPWGLGHNDWPLTPEHMCQPDAGKTFNCRAQAWQQNLNERIDHRPVLPKNVEYVTPCLPGCCQQRPGFAHAGQMERPFLESTKLMGMYLVAAEGPTDYATEIFIVAHAMQRPQERILLRLTPCGSTNYVDIESATNFPWQLQLGRVQAPGEQAPSLDFVHFKDLLCDMAEMRCLIEADDIMMASLEYIPLSFDKLEAHKLLPFNCLFGGSLEDLVGSLAALEHNVLRTQRWC